MKLALHCKSLLLRHDRTATIVTLDTFSPEALQYWRRAGCFVNTACPRISTDDFAKYAVPIVTPPELEIALGLRDWKDGYVFDEISGDRRQHEVPAPES